MTMNKLIATSALILALGTTNALAGNEVDLLQQGADNVANTTQTGSDNRITMQQIGDRNIADIEQVGSTNLLTATQYGDDNNMGVSINGTANNVWISEGIAAPGVFESSNINANVRVEGDANLVTAGIGGDNNNASINVQGKENHTYLSVGNGYYFTNEFALPSNDSSYVIEQVGNHNDVSISSGRDVSRNNNSGVYSNNFAAHNGTFSTAQTGDDNFVSMAAYGTNTHIASTQTGDRNTANLGIGTGRYINIANSVSMDAASDNHMQLAQTGNDNEATILQGAYGDQPMWYYVNAGNFNTANVTQTGNRNVADIAQGTQGSNNNVANLRQIGTGNRATIRQ